MPPRPVLSVPHPGGPEGHPRPSGQDSQPQQPPTERNGKSPPWQVAPNPHHPDLSQLLGHARTQMSSSVVPPPETAFPQVSAEPLPCPPTSLPEVKFPAVPG